MFAVFFCPIMASHTDELQKLWDKGMAAAVRNAAALGNKKAASEETGKAERLAAIEARVREIMEQSNRWNSMSPEEQADINDELDKLNAEAAKLEGRAQYQARKEPTDYNEPITPADINELRKMGGLSINKFTSKDIDATAKWATRFYKEIGTKSPFFRAWFGEWRAYDALNAAYATTIQATANISYANRTVENADTKWTVQITKDTMEDSIHHAGKERPYMERLLSEIDAVLKRAILLDTAVSEKNTANKKGSTQFMHYLYSIVEYNGNPFLAKITVEEYGNEGSRRAYNVARIKMSSFSRAQYSQMKSAYRGSFASNDDALSVADLVSLVKCTQFVRCAHSLD